MICERCKADVARILWTVSGWGFPRCTDPERMEVSTFFSERLHKVKGFGWVTRQQEREWRDKGAFIERQVNPKTGDVKTRPMSRKEGTRVYFPMGG